MCVQIKNKVHHVNQLKEPDLMMYTHIPLSKKKTTPPTPLHSPPTPLHSTHSNPPTPRTPLTYSKYSSHC